MANPSLESRSAQGRNRHKNDELESAETQAENEKNELYTHQNYPHRDGESDVESKLVDAHNAIGNALEAQQKQGAETATAPPRSDWYGSKE